MKINYRQVKKFLNIDWSCFQKSLEFHAHLVPITPTLKSKNKVMDKIIALCVAWKIKNGFDKK